MNQNESSVVTQVQSKIYMIRGQRVMLDSDLAELYGSVRIDSAIGRWRNSKSTS